MSFHERVFLSVYDHFTAWSVPNKDWGNLIVRNRVLRAWITTFQVSVDSDLIV